MILTEVTTIPGAALPVQGLKDHLRMGSGFADDGMQDALLETHLRAAVATIEGRVGKALITRTFRWRIDDWRSLSEQALPLAPVASIASVSTFTAEGVETTVPATAYVLSPDTHRPRLVARGTLFPTVPEDGHIEIVLDAGFGAAWANVPPDLQQAVLLLAAAHYERRHDASAAEGGLSRTILTLIERWRTVRVLGGGLA